MQRSLSEKTVKAIKTMLNEGFRQVDISEILGGIKVTTISLIARGLIYKDEIKEN